MLFITIPKITNAENTKVIHKVNTYKIVKNKNVIHTSKTKKLITNQDVLISKPTKPNPNNITTTINNIQYKEIKFDEANVDKDFEGYNYSNSNIVIIPYYRPTSISYIVITR